MAKIAGLRDYWAQRLATPGSALRRALENDRVLDDQERRVCVDAYRAELQVLRAAIAWDPR